MAPRVSCGWIISAGGLGLFVRSLVGLERDAAKRAFDQFTAGKSPPLTANQLELVDMIVDHLTERGAHGPAPALREPVHGHRPPSALPAVLGSGT